MIALKAKTNKTTKVKPDNIAAEAIELPLLPAQSKQEQVIALLRSGTTVVAIQQLTGWQRHSIRGFISGTMRKKLGMTVTAEKSEAGTIYRVAA